MARALLAWLRQPPWVRLGTPVGHMGMFRKDGLPAERDFRGHKGTRNREAKEPRAAYGYSGKALRARAAQNRLRNEHKARLSQGSPAS